MNEKISKLEEVRPKPDEDVVALLEEALEEAKQGNLRSVVVLGYSGNGAVTTIAPQIAYNDKARTRKWAKERRKASRKINRSKRF